MNVHIRPKNTLGLNTNIQTIDFSLFFVNFHQGKNLNAA